MSNAPKPDTFHTVDQDFIRNTKGEVVGQYCYQDDGRLFVRFRDYELNGKKLTVPQWRAWMMLE